MNTQTHSARRLLVAFIFSVGLAVATVAQAAQPQFTGPRNTIPQTQSVKQPAEQALDRLRASRDDMTMCQSVRIEHYGHPGKGVNRVERIDVSCGKTRLSTR